MSATGSVGWAIAAGVVVGLACALAAMWSGFRQFRAAWRRYRPRRPTVAPPGFLRPPA